MHRRCCSYSKEGIPKYGTPGLHTTANVTTTTRGCFKRKFSYWKPQHLLLHGVFDGWRHWRKLLTSCLTEFVRAVPSMSREKTQTLFHVWNDYQRKGGSLQHQCLVELEKECNNFRVVGPLAAGEDTDHQPCPMPTSLDHHSIHIVNLDNQSCICGIWQDFLYPCQHACAVDRKCKETTFSFILSDMVPDIYKFGYVKKTFVCSQHALMELNMTG